MFKFRNPFKKAEVEESLSDDFSKSDFHVSSVTPTVASLSGNFAVPYNPAQAENGKFVRLDTSTLTDYPLTGQGKYAVLTYNVNPIEVNNTVAISGVNVDIDEPIEIEYPNTTYNMSSTYPANAVYTVSFGGTISHLEIYVKSGSTYLALNDGIGHTLQSLSAQGLYLEAGSYYANDYVATQIVFGSIAEVDLRIFGNYRS